MNILITGSTGFVGTNLYHRLLDDGIYNPISVVRSNEDLANNTDAIRYGHLSESFDWSAALDGIDVIVHLAARVHQIHASNSDISDLYINENTNSTIRLASQAIEAGVKRFIFISSIKVNGEFTKDGSPFSSSSKCKPIDSYGISKLEAEKHLRELSIKSDMEVVIIRPPLVYGPGVKANFRKLLSLVHISRVLPFGSVHNTRSFVYVDNLVDLIVTCIEHPLAKNQIFLVADGEGKSTAELLRIIARYMNKKLFLVPFPSKVLYIFFRLIGKSTISSRLLENLEVDFSKTCTLLDWSPPVDFEKGISKTVSHFLDTSQCKIN